MRPIASHDNEVHASHAFSGQSGVFDAQYAGNAIVAYKRQRVREHLLRLAQPGGRILELNSGTGDDAVFLAAQGFRVHATDISEGMQQMLQKKIHDYHLNNRVTTELCSFTRLDALKDRGPYDVIFSNFGGLNCTSELEKVLKDLPGLLKPGGG